MSLRYNYLRAVKCLLFEGFRMISCVDWLGFGNSHLLLGVNIFSLYLAISTGCELLSTVVSDSATIATSASF